MATVINISGTPAVDVITSSLKLSRKRGQLSTLSFDIATASATTPGSRGAAVTLVVGGTTYFSGVIDTVKTGAWVPSENHLRHTVSCTGDDEALRKELIWEVFTKTAAHAIFTTLVSTYLPGWTTGGVGTGSKTIDVIRFDGVTLFQAFDMLAQRTETWEWSYTPGKVFTFEAVSLLSAAGFNLTDGPSNKPYSNLEHVRAPGRYYNACIVYGGDGKTGTIKEEMTLPGDNTYNATKHRVASVSAVTLDITGTPTVVTYGQRGVDADTSSPKGAVFSQNHTIHEVLSKSAAGNKTNRWEYVGIRPVIYGLRDAEAINTRGLYMGTVSDASLQTIEDAHDAAAAFLSRYGQWEVDTIQFDTWTAGLDPGEAITVSLAALNLSGTFVIETVETTEATYEVLRHRVTATSGNTLPAAGQAAKLAVNNQAGNNKVGADGNVPLRRPIFPTEVLVPTATVTVVDA